MELDLRLIIIKLLGVMIGAFVILFWLAISRWAIIEILNRIELNRWDERYRLWSKNSEEVPPSTKAADDLIHRSLVLLRAR